MPGEMTDEWQEFAVDKKNPGKSWGCLELEEASHTTHIEHGLEIVRSREIKPSLIYDESILRSERILVNWLSPNDWRYGSRYGNVKFVFDWSKIVASARLYWVESIKKYSPPACRILLTKKDRDQDALLHRYDPSRGNGPLWFDPVSNKVWWNGTICLELMLEGSLQLSDIRRIDFESHHRDYCCISPSSCRDRNLGQWDAGALFLAGLAGNEIRAVQIGLTWLHNGDWVARGHVHAAWTSMERYFRNLPTEYAGYLRSSDQSSVATARAILASMSRRNNAECAGLAKNFANCDEMIASCVHVLNATLGLDAEWGIDSRTRHPEVEHAEQK